MVPHNRRILVVEDEALLAIEIASALEKAGFDVLGPAQRVSNALKLVRHHGCDAAVLDINLGKETSEPVALELSARGTPFVIVSSDVKKQQPPAFRKAPSLNKPVKIELLVAELSRQVTKPQS